jgi:aldehyde dehydrogenase (NAD(P)+)
MLALADLIDQHKEVLATIETWDNGNSLCLAFVYLLTFPSLGKPYNASLEDDLNEVINTIKYFAGWADKVHGQTVGTTSAKLAYTLRRPVGVVGQIIPWNFPLAMAAMKLAPALACGNTVILKPAEQTPLSILYLANLIRDAGFPPGVINILNGYGKVAGSALVTHPDVDKIAFTGSTSTGKEVMKMAAGTLKDIILETGGKSPLIVFQDADLQQAVKWAHIGVMYNQGQVCTATSRILVHNPVYEPFVALFKTMVASKYDKVGDPFAGDTFQGPQVSRAQYERVLSFIESGKSEGATLVAGGEPIKSTSDGKGFYIAPAIFTNVTDSMRIYREEVFGPLVVISSFATEEEAIIRANDTQYGLGAAIFSKNIERAHRVAAEIEAGTIWINSSNDSDFRVAFGGLKQSGIGYELGQAGVEAYSQIKAIHVNLGAKL